MQQSLCSRFRGNIIILNCAIVALSALASAECIGSLSSFVLGRDDYTYTCYYEFVRLPPLRISTVPLCLTSLVSP